MDCVISIENGEVGFLIRSNNFSMDAPVHIDIADGDMKMSQGGVVIAIFNQLMDKVDQSHFDDGDLFVVNIKDLGSEDEKIEITRDVILRINDGNFFS